MKSLANASRMPGVPAVRRWPSQESGMRMTNCESWWQPDTHVWPGMGGGVQPGMNGVPSLAVSAGSAWKALHASANQPSICSPLTGGEVGLVYFELSVPEPGGGKRSEEHTSELQ